MTSAPSSLNGGESAQETNCTFVVVILDRERKPQGMGILVDRDTVITCTHVVNKALGRATDAADRPSDGTLVSLYFPYTNDDRKGKVRDWFPPENRSVGQDICALRLTVSAPEKLNVAKFSCAKPGIQFKAARRTGSKSPLQWGYAVTGNSSERGFYQVEAIQGRPFLQNGHSGSPAICLYFGYVLGMVAWVDGETAVGHVISSEHIGALFEEVRQQLDNHAAQYQQYMLSGPASLPQTEEEIAEARRRKKRLEKPELLPYAMNRDPQLNAFRSELRSLIEKAVLRSSSSHPVFICTGREKDCPERLLERFDEVEGPLICEDKCKELGQPGRFYFKKPEGGLSTGWPKAKDAKPSDVEKFIRNYIDSTHVSGTGLARTTVENFRLNESQFVHEWFVFWEGYFARKPDSMLIPVLNLCIDQGDGWLNWQTRNAIKNVKKVVQNWCDVKNHDSRHIVPIRLEELQNVTRENAEKWSSFYIAQSSFRRDADLFIDAHFGRSAVTQAPITQAMEKIARLIQKAPWFRDFITKAYRDEI